jgi:hypothetical protein
MKNNRLNIIDEIINSSEIQVQKYKQTHTVVVMNSHLKTTECVYL